MLAITWDFDGAPEAEAAIVFVDVVGYSALMAADERGTFNLVRALLDGALTPSVAGYGGVVVKGTGDGLLIRFGDAAVAVAWAEAAQATAQESPLEVRISVHLGSVILAEGDIYGDGVNVAARLLEHAPPGGISFSEPVLDALTGQASGRAIDLGLRTLKSFARPVRVFAIAPAGVSLLRTTPVDSAVPSVAVLPLQNLGGDADDDYLADGIVEAIIVSMAGLGELFVVSHASTLAFAGRRVDPRDVGRVLGVRYVVTGTLRRSARMVRVAMELCDAASGQLVWQERAEVPPDEVFNMQDRLVGQIVSRIAPGVRVSEMRRAMRKQPESLSAYDHTLRGMHLVHSFGGGGFAAARECLLLALADDRGFGLAHAWLAWWYVLSVGQGRTAGVPAEQEVLLALDHATQALEYDANNALALAIKGHVNSFLLRRYETGLALLEQALAVSPSCTVAWALSAASLAYTGSGAQAVAHAEQALRLSPLDRNLFLTQTVLCLAHYAAGTYAEAVRWGTEADQTNPDFTATHRLLMGSLIADGKVSEARAVGARMLALEPAFDLDLWERQLQPFRDGDMGRLYKERLRIALQA